ncbi:hypothetical protein PCE1_001451 [Barthelona sp. PCE]
MRDSPTSINAPFLDINVRTDTSSKRIRLFLVVSVAVISTVLILFLYKGQEEVVPMSDIYLNEHILVHAASWMQARGINDSKHFVDMPSYMSPNSLLQLWNNLNLKHSQIVYDFFESNFLDPATDIHTIRVDDWSEEPDILENIENQSQNKTFNHINQLWKTMTKVFRQEYMGKSLQTFSHINLPYPFVVPGGRFREFYYWDSLWILSGLLVSDMHQTSFGMLRNMATLINKYGFVPNGARTYYTDRSQPPVFGLMLKTFVRYPGVQEFLETEHCKQVFKLELLPALAKEIEFFYLQRMKDGMLRYSTSSDRPRPESYKEDLKILNEGGSMKSIRATAESGWDFSARWMSIECLENPSHERCTTFALRTDDIAPVELHAFFLADVLAMKEMQQLFTNDEDDGANVLYDEHLEFVQRALNTMFDSDVGLWFDGRKDHGRVVTPAAVSPLFVASYFPDVEYCQHMISNTTVEQLNASLDSFMSQPGGIPASMLKETGQQWDFPNVWAPLVDMTYRAFKALNATDEAESIKAKYMAMVEDSVEKYDTIYEKYDCENLGEPGGAGEYNVVTGFGWTNGLYCKFLYETVFEKDWIK